VKNEKEQTEGNNCSFSEKESFFLNARERILYTLRLLFALQREREREKEKRRRRASPQRKAFKSFVVLPRFLPLDFFEYLLKREEEEQSLGEERNSST
jgi:hypothetical protein